MPGVQKTSSFKDIEADIQTGQYGRSNKGRSKKS
mgnify:CR=1 FL=1